MTDAPQQTVLVASEPGFWATVDRVVTDLLTQQIPASVVLLIIFVMTLPWITRFIWRWFYGEDSRYHRGPRK